jgi:phospholipase/carboxylesterase
MAHGTQDQVIPVQLAEASKRALEQRGYDVAWQTWPMPHSVCAEEVEELGGFFIRAYGGSRDDEPRSSTILLAR